jgi:hypothetical protein
MRPIEVGIDVPEGWRRAVYAEDQPEYLPLPVLKSSSSTGEVISRWQLSWRERLAILCGRDLFLVLATFHKPLQPIRLIVGEPGFRQ